MAKPRLFVEHLKTENNQIALAGDAHHYLSRVMRMKAGGEVVVFDGKSASLEARILEVTKHETRLETLGIEQDLQSLPPLALAFAPIKKARTDFIVEKAAELGVASIQPVLTEYTNAERVRVDRLQRHVIEAVEQCGGNAIPEVKEEMSLDAFLQKDTNGQLLFCDEMAEQSDGMAQLEAASADFWTIMIGPEGGFSQKERTMILTRGALRLSLGARILRADTAAVAAITLWHYIHGDWR